MLSFLDLKENFTHKLQRHCTKQVFLGYNHKNIKPSRNNRRGGGRKGIFCLHLSQMSVHLLRIFLRRESFVHVFGNYI